MRTITEEEVEKAVKKMKTVGVDDLSVEMVKANRLVGTKWLNQAASKQERYQQSGEEE